MGNADRSRIAILDAAAALFAERGYRATSLADVGLRAGVSRGTPGYFFGSKSALYGAVMDRCCEEVRDAVRSGRARARESGRSPRDILAGAVGEYFDFLHSHPDFVRLIERSALGSEELPADLRPAVTAGREALAAIADEVDLDPSPGGEASQLLLSILSLCWFSVVHADTVAAAVGVPLATDSDRERRKAHVIALVRSGLDLRDRPVSTPRKKTAHA